MSGSGWGLDILSVYGISFAGIQLILQKHQENVALIKSKEDFRDAIQKQPENSVLIAIIEAQVLQNTNSSSHVYTICSRKEAEKNILYLYDSCAIDINLKVIQELYAGTMIELAFPNKIRQLNRETNCVAFAITDARLLTRGTYMPPRHIKSQFDKVQTHIFELDEKYQYDALLIKKALFNELITTDFSQTFEHEAHGIISLSGKNLHYLVPSFLIFCIVGLLLYQVIKSFEDSMIGPKPPC